MRDLCYFLYEKNEKKVWHKSIEKWALKAPQWLGIELVVCFAGTETMNGEERKRG